MSSFVKMFISSFIQSKQHISKSSSLNLLIYHMHYAMSPWSLYRYPSNNAVRPQLLWNITIFEGNWKYKQLFQFTSITIQVWENSSSTSSELIENFHFCQAWKVRHNPVLKFLVQFLGKPANQLLQTEIF